MLASVPELAKRTRSIDGIRSQRMLAHSTSVRVVASPGGPRRRLGAHRRHDVGMGVPVDQRGRVVVQVEAAIPVDVPYVGAFPALEVGRVRAGGDRVPGVTAREDPSAADEQGRRPGGDPAVLVDDRPDTTRGAVPALMFRSASAGGCRGSWS